MVTSPPVPPGYELRRCTADDVAAVAELHVRRTGAADAEDFRLVAGDPDAGAGWAAAVFDTATGRPVSTLTLLDEVVRVGAVDVPAGQVELVVTDEEHEGRGLVRALMTWAADEGARRGHLVAPMVGISYFYRQFDYSYAIPIGEWRPVAAVPGPVDASITVRTATVADIDALVALSEAARGSVDVSMTHTRACWRWIVARSGSVLDVAERDGRVVASIRVIPPDEGQMAAELLAADDAAAVTILAAIAADRPDLCLLDRPRSPAGRAVDAFLGAAADPEPTMGWYYVRIPDPTPLLEHLRPELQRRLDAAALTDLPERLLISSYRSHVEADLSGGVLGPFREGGPLQAPVSRGGSGIPPDALAPLLFGPYGALGLERRWPDVLLGRQRELMAALFPPLAADVATFYLPC